MASFFLYPALELFFLLMAAVVKRSCCCNGPILFGSLPLGGLLTDPVFDLAGVCRLFEFGSVPALLIRVNQMILSSMDEPFGLFVFVVTLVPHRLDML